MARAEPNSRRGARDSLGIQPVKTAYQQVADQLRSLILGGDLSPGDRLPPESELIELFGVSRGTVREALRALASQGLITTSRGATGSR
jgi:GntR family transcriptional repressor for pyruvate dehydrogenase complex